jgi:hypothetical protein
VVCQVVIDDRKNLLVFCWSPTYTINNAIILRKSTLYFQAQFHGFFCVEKNQGGVGPYLLGDN